MNNPNMYTNKRKGAGFLKYIIIWYVILAIVVFLLIKSLGTGKGNSYTWTINEYEYALTNDNSDSSINEDNFKTTYKFSRDNVSSIQINLGMMKSNAVVTYLDAETNKRATATVEWTSYENPLYSARVDDALAATRAAVEEGIIAGGGIALLRSIKSLEKI